MLRVGLTGGIASGKTTVASMLRDRDIQILEMDPIGHELLEPGQSAYDEVIREFGDGILGSADKIDRAKLGAIVFADATRREKLNQILHPRILAVVQQWFAALEGAGDIDVAVVEAALIVESNFHKQLDRLIVCWSTPEQQLQRLVERGLTEDDARRRMAAQMPAEEKRKLADIVIDCSKTMEETERQVEAAVAKLRGAPAGREIR
jgi:dephospho-CoA kinase